MQSLLLSATQIYSLEGNNIISFLLNSSGEHLCVRKHMCSSIFENLLKYKLQYTKGTVFLKKNFFGPNETFGSHSVCTYKHIYVLSFLPFSFFPYFPPFFSSSFNGCLLMDILTLLFFLLQTILQPITCTYVNFYMLECICKVNSSKYKC